MRSYSDFNDGWVFHEGFSGALTTDAAPGNSVRLPHTAVELPFSYFDERDYQRPFTYQKVFTPEPGWAGCEVTLLFDGAMANSVVYLNGVEIASHKDGYTPFAARLTGRLKPGKNLITLALDGSENPDIPPFGGRIDYLTYAGIYRDVTLRITAPIWLSNPKIETPDVLGANKTVTVRAEINNLDNQPLGGTVSASIKDRNGKVVGSTSMEVDGKSINLTFANLGAIELWDINNPALYTLEMSLETPSGRDWTSNTFGFRHVDFTTEGFKLNGRALKLRGLNRHQSFPYSGYALGRVAQERDAEILKNELHVNIVRTSHYPQSKYFLDRCDQLGLLVFEEIPGWQHIGGDVWKAEAVENVKRMIRRDWNHPSIVIWGVRINESADSHDFYAETNRIAHELDTTRPTGGVRYITESELLEDVYTMNDFILGNEELGGNRPRTALRPQREVTGLDHIVPYLITEYGGHMYPTKSFDQEQRQVEHVRRHLEVLNAAYGDPQIAGCIGWCAFDYNTHKDFGSGDRICHHGVMDMFREPKFAAYAYASQCEPHEDVILQPVTFWARGERNIGGTLPLMILTNCDEVELRYGNHPGKRIGPDRESFPHLPHAPVILDRRHFTKDELGLWGMEWLGVTIVGYVGGKPAREVKFVADPVPARLELTADNDRMSRSDQVRVMVRALDQAGNKLPFFPEPVSIAVSGAARLKGPELVPLRAGSTGFWVEATGVGPINIKVTNDRLGTAAIELTAA